MSSFNVFDLFCIEVFNALAAFLYCVGTFIECLNFVSISDCFVREDFAFVYVFVCLMVRLRLSTNMNWRRCEHVSWMTAQSLTFSCFSNRQRAPYRALCAGTKWTLFDGSHTTKHVRSAIFTFALLSHKKKNPKLNRYQSISTLASTKHTKLMHSMRRMTKQQNVKKCWNLKMFACLLLRDEKANAM